MITYKNGRIKVIYKGHAICKQKTKISISKTETREDYEIPYVSYYYFKPKYNVGESVTIPLYLTDYYQKEYRFNDTSETFKLTVDLDGIITEINGIKAGDYDLILGELSVGQHYFSVKVTDSDGFESATLYNELLITDVSTINEYIMTENDLSTYNITLNLNETATSEQMKNNRVGLTNLLSDVVNNGFNKITLLNGIYRINRTIRNGVGEETPIIIPSNLIVNLNESTIKLHPYDDREYGEVAQVENLMIDFRDSENSELTNGIIEGDFAERKELLWGDGTNAFQNGNGEHSSAIRFKGGKYNSLNNLTITQITGYNLITTFGDISTGKIISNGGFEDNIKLNNKGETIEKTGYTTNGFQDLSNYNYDWLCVSIWLAMGGIKGYHWDMDVCFYDENQKFIKKITTLQFRRFKIPTNSKYFRVTFRCSSDEVSDVSFHSQPSPKYCEYRNLNLVDNRTCIAVSQVQHLLIDNLKFTRSGQDITPSEIDFEDGWEQCQDVFIQNCEILENTGTADVIVCAGLNMHFNNNINMSLTPRYRIYGMTIHDNVGGSINLTLGYMTKCQTRIYDNEINGNLSVNVTNEGFYGYDNTIIYPKNNTIIFNYCNGFKRMRLKNNIVYLNGSYSNIENHEIFKGATIYLTDAVKYIGGNIYFSECNFYGIEGENVFSYNALNVKREYINCVFNMICRFRNHNNWNTGFYKNCTFKEDLVLYQPNSNTDGDILFENCIFEKNVTININIEDSYIKFVNCSFKNEPIFNGSYGKSNTFIE